MDHSDQAGDDNTQKRKRRPKSYQGCTQCRLARRKCGEGNFVTHSILSGNLRAFASKVSCSTERTILMLCQE